MSTQKDNELRGMGLTVLNRNQSRLYLTQHVDEVKSEDVGDVRWNWFKAVALANALGKTVFYDVSTKKYFVILVSGMFVSYDEDS